MKINKLATLALGLTSFVPHTFAQVPNEVIKFGNILNKITQPQRQVQPANNDNPSSNISQPTQPTKPSTRESTPKETKLSSQDQGAGNVTNQADSTNPTAKPNDQSLSDSFVERRKFPPATQSLNWHTFTPKNLSLYYIPESLAGNPEERKIQVRIDSVAPSGAKYHLLLDIIANCNTKTIGIKRERSYRDHDPIGRLMLKPEEVEHYDEDTAKPTYYPVTADPDFPEILNRACKRQSYPKTSAYWEIKQEDISSSGKISGTADFRGITIGMPLQNLAKTSAFTTSDYSVKRCIPSVFNRKESWRAYEFGDEALQCNQYPYFGSKGSLFIYSTGGRVSYVKFFIGTNEEANEYIPELVRELARSRFNTAPMLVEGFEGVPDGLQSRGVRQVNFRWNDSDGNSYSVLSFIEKASNSSSAYKISISEIDIIPKDFEGVRFARALQFDKFLAAKQTETKKKGGL